MPETAFFPPFNLVVDPSFEGAGLSNWQYYLGGSAETPGWSQSADPNHVVEGAKASIFLGTNPAGATRSKFVWEAVGHPVAPGDVYYLRAHPFGATHTCRLGYRNQAGGFEVASGLTARGGGLSGSGFALEGVLVVPAGVTAIQLGLMLENVAASTAYAVAFDAFAFVKLGSTTEQSPGYFDGDTDGYGWMGTPHASVSGRTRWYGDKHEAMPGTRTSQPGGLEMVFEYNGLVIHDREVVDKVRLVEIDGLQGIGIRDSRTQAVNDHGDVPFDNYYEARTIVLTGRIETNNVDKLRDMQQAVRTAFMSLVELPLTLRNRGFETEIFCRPVGKLSTSEKQDGDRFWRDFQVTLLASKPNITSVLYNEYEEVLNFEDTFATDKGSLYRLLPGTSGFVHEPSTQNLRPAITTGACFRMLDLEATGYRPDDVRVEIKVTGGSAPAPDTRIFIKYVDDANHLFATMGNGVHSIWRVKAGVTTQLAAVSNAFYTIAAGQTRWFYFTCQGNTLTVGSSGSDNIPLALTHEMSGEDRSLFGSLDGPVRADVGFGVGVATDSGYRIDDLKVRSRTINLLPVELYNEGNFPAYVNLEFQGKYDTVQVVNSTLGPREEFARTVKFLPGSFYYVNGPIKYDGETGLPSIGGSPLSPGFIKFLSPETTGILMWPGKNVLLVSATGMDAFQSVENQRFKIIYADTWG